MANASKKKIIRRFIGDESGAIAIMFALMLPVIMGFVGLGIDAGMWFKERRNMQTATDAAAVSAAIELTFGATEQEMIDIAKTEATRHGYVDGVDTLGLNPDFVHNGIAGHVEVTIVHPLNTFLSQIISNIVPQSTTRAVATTSGNADACMLSLGGTGSGISLNAASATVTMSGCGAFANSSDLTNSVKINNGTMEVDCLWAHGGVNATTGLASSPNPGEDLLVGDDCQIMEGVATMDDPFSDLVVPAYSSCNVGTSGQHSTNQLSGTLSNAGGSGNLTAPTIICGGIKINSGDTLNVDPGVYIIDGGDLDISGGATLNATGVTFIIAGALSGSYGGASINGGSTINWSAPTLSDYNALTDTGTNNYMGQNYTNYTGITLFQSSPAGSGSTNDISFNGGASATISGALYVPNNDISFGGNAGIMPSGCLQLVGQVVQFGGSAQIQNQCSMYGGNPVNYGAAPGLVE